MASVAEIEEIELLRALSQQQGVPAVDLASSVLSLSALTLIPEQIALEAKILPLELVNDCLTLAMARSDDKRLIDEIAFVTGKKVEPLVALESHLMQAIQAAYSLFKSSPSSLLRGKNANVREFHLAILSEQLPEVSIAPDEELVTIEISTEDEIIAKRTEPLILVVDDEPDIVKMLERALVAEGYRVVSASRGLQALQAVKSHNPDLILLDAMLPEIHGFEICKKIKGSNKYGKIPVVMVSAIYRGWRYAQDAKETYGADDFFEKPFRLVPLLRRVRELLNCDRRENSGVDTGSALPFYKQGVSLYREHRFEEAEQALREACKHDPFSANIHYALANVLLARNLVFEAMREYEEAIELKPELFGPLRNLAILYQRKGFRNKALEMWERALRSSPESERENVRAELIKLL